MLPAISDITFVRPEPAGIPQHAVPGLITDLHPFHVNACRLECLQDLGRMLRHHGGQRRRRLRIRVAGAAAGGQSQRQSSEKGKEKG